MEKSAFKFVIVEERVLILGMRRVSVKSRLYDVQVKKRVPIKLPEPSIIVTENGYLYCRKDEEAFSCPLTEKERILVKAVLATTEHTLGDAFAVFGLNVWEKKDKKKMQNIVGNLNLKMEREHVPLKLVWADWYLKILRL